MGCDFGEREIKEKKIFNFAMFVCQETTRTIEKRKKKVFKKKN